MDKKLILWIVIAILVLAVIDVVFFRSSPTGGVISAGQSAGQVAKSSYGGMVGGC